MDKLQTILKGFPPSLDAWQTYHDYDQFAKAHVEAVTRLPDAARILISTNAKSVFQWLRPDVHTLSYLAVLDVLLQPGSTYAASDEGLLKRAVESFFTNFNGVDVRFMGDVLLRLIKRILGEGLLTPQEAIPLISSAILRIDPGGTMFTTTHTFLANLVLLSPTDSGAALAVFDRDITAYPSNTNRDDRALSDPTLPPSMYISSRSGLTETVKANMILDYGAALGQIYISRRDWAKARAALERVLTHPVKEKGVPLEMVQAYQKWVLVGLLDGGKSPALPSYTPSAAKSSFTKETAYNALATAFDGNEAGPLQTEITTHGAAYETDGNAGLVQEVLDAYQKWQIINLRKTYARVAISKIRESTFSGRSGEYLQSNEEAKALVNSMIQSGMLQASFETSEDGQDEYVAFQDDSSVLSEQRFAEEIARRHANIEKLSEQYKAVNDKLSGHRDFAKQVYKEQRRAATEGAQPEGFDASVEDEDLMSGIVAVNG